MATATTGTDELSGYLYVFQVDSSGKCDWLFPQNESSTNSSGINPVAPGQLLSVPPAGSSNAFYLDANAGIEHIYAVFSATRWPALEEALPKPPPAKVPGQMAHGTRVQEPNRLGLRGVGGTHASPSPLNT